jgi:tRNA pseudouridine(55) synthase
MENTKDVLALYKQLGETPQEAIVRWKKENPGHDDMTMTYAGRLDPMAEGLLLVLSGEALKEKEKYIGLSKTYEFEMLWGFGTDTFDVLGKVTKESASSSPDKEEFIKEISQHIGRFQQLYPPYSSKPVSGKPLWKWAREGRLSQIELPTHEVDLYDVEFLERKEISGPELLQEIEKKLALVLGDFRQEESLVEWRKRLASREKEAFSIDKIRIRVSSGFYVRQFVQDAASVFAACAATFHIKRMEIGAYKL